ncbi:MAG: Fumarylacetoacetate hydrolase family protein [uncultured Rubrobacteraceae bacterium]|uniref:Fumarylacetoacetate hydrolase family protein n=1 Tax=uncultured Rubrobacteraceae bacterium TaxID=349277 RepID=A0A6J4R3W0_9ACTN|nr:MAG: Fumarylacetoacetate hydrolase family protein [uncultured Rubrobacteraceae bacterium]
MRFASCRVGERRFAAVVEGGEVRPLAGIAELGADTDADLLADPPVEDGTAHALEDVEMLPAVPRPGKIICLGLNYHAHVEETRRDLPTYPVLFTKFAESLVGPYAPIVKPPESSEVDYEAELAVVIGRAARRVAPEHALEFVAGYAVANDVTVRDYQYKTHQWLQGKSWSDSTPLGPFLVTPDEVGDPGKLDITLDLNGERMQSSSTGLLIFDVPTIVSTLSEFVTLEPGDVILTGTPGGVGYRRDPQVFLQPGDRVRVEISGVGAIENEVVAE